MNASMYILVVLAVVMANWPFLSPRFLALIPVAKKHFGHQLLELVLAYVLVGVLAYVLESRAGAVHSQGVTFYVVSALMFLVLAFPTFVWRYFWHSKHRE